MQTIRSFVVLSTLSIVAIASSLGGCEKKSEPSKPASSGTTTQKDHDHKDGDGHDHDDATQASPMSAGSHDGHDHGDGHDHRATTELGEQSAGGFTIKALRDGEIVAGKDAAIDVSVTGGTAKVNAVRIWIGTQDGKGSMKAKAQLEKNNWHTHVEIPSPLPAGSKLWVEIESENSERTVVDFNLKL